MNCSEPKWISGPTGSRKCEVRSGEQCSTNCGIVSQPSSLFSKPYDSPGVPKICVGFGGTPSDWPIRLSAGCDSLVAMCCREKPFEMTSYAPTLPDASTAA